ncbi:DNA polymerase IV [Hornefia butyriciproducens]|uniref:DNA polymerase IV n=1 Tax=Hornefia butyriciproducens TaxID=2652293 RepID=UPI002A912EE7|nr:DNA polymerase IV [Hornefia butyriciproducens]MCI7413013.1 DNA polymerase IV [Clostridiales bacterium]MDY6212511.1 DNA polymerase IV [Hornefia butyriciproducens]
MDRIILHCDINSFFASVELLDHPELRDMPVAVSGDPELRHGIILAKNQAAKACGVVTAETVWQARRKCPDLVLLPPQHEKYREFSRRLNRLYQEYTDMVEPFSIDESWLDVTASRALFGSGTQIADRIRHRVREELGITLSAGVSYNKIFAKMGSEYRKPDATTEITRSNYQQLLWPMPVNEMFFVGFATAERLKAADIHTIGDLALADTRMLERLLGKQGPLLRSYARGEDDSPVRRYDQRNKIKSVGNGITFRRNLTGEDDILTALTRLSDTVAGRLRKYQLKAGGVKVDIKDTQLKTISRQTQLTRPTNLSDELRRTAMELIRSFWPSQKPIRLITLTAISLCDETGEEQLSLFREENAAREKTESVERTMDAIRSRFGDSAIGFGQIIGNDIGIDL